MLPTPRTVRHALAAFRATTLATLTALAVLASGGVAAQGAASPEYEVQPNDVLNVYVWREVDLQLDVLVRPDGSFSMPLAGDVNAVGRTVGELAEDVKARLQEFIPDPEVSVSVREVRGNVFFVVGKVQRPGQFLLTGPMTVVQALGVAGGLTPFAADSRISVLRQQGDEQVALPFNYDDVADGRNLTQNIRLRSGDVVVVP